MVAMKTIGFEKKLSELEKEEQLNNNILTSLIRQHSEIENKIEKVVLKQKTLTQEKIIILKNKEAYEKKVKERIEGIDREERNIERLYARLKIMKPEWTFHALDRARQRFHRDLREILYSEMNPFNPNKGWVLLQREGYVFTFKSEAHPITAVIDAQSLRILTVY